MTLEEAALRVNMDKRTFQRIESGETHKLDFDLLEQIAEGLGEDYKAFLPSGDSFFIRSANNGSGSVYHDKTTFGISSEDLSNLFQKGFIEKDKTITDQTRHIEEQRMLIDKLQELLSSK